MYVDDLLSGADNISEAIRISEEIVHTLKAAGMHLRKWSSNSTEFLKAFNTKIRPEEAIVFNQPGDITQILGLQWTPNADQFRYHVKLDSTPSYTKRTILSEFSRIFDPLGLLSPFSVRIKIMFQELWMMNLTWDEPLPPEAYKKWFKLREEIPELSSVTISRWLGQANELSVLHGFCDASEKAYAAAIYLVSNCKGVRQCQLITAKTKLAPVERVSLPRLELCGALLGTKLIQQIGIILGIPSEGMYLWTDSQIVLDWLSDVPRRWNVYVANRTSKILKIIPRKHWFHVPSARNAADCATRGLTPQELIQHSLWWHGPEFLLLSTEHWPKVVHRPKKMEPLEARTRTVMMMRKPSLEENFIYDVQARYSSFRKLTMILAYIYRAVQIWTHKVSLKPAGLLTREEVMSATERIMKAIQIKSYGTELYNLQNNIPIPNDSKVRTLDPIIDGTGLIRVGGRIENAPMPIDQRHPIILPSHDAIVKKLITHYHVKNFHCGPSFLIHALRQQYWIIGIRRMVHGMLKNCVKCIKQKPKLLQQKMGMLPHERIELVKAFQRTGVDFFGPISTYLIHGRGQRVRKSYGCIFVCMCTKALHLELVTDLSSDAFLAAFDRFVARRGVVTDVYSDNGSNFRGAKRKLDELNQLIVQNSKGIASAVMRQHQITWHFIPAYSPHFGGLWEAGVKSVKTHLSRVTGEKILSMEELYTLLVQVEAMLNNRPLYSSGPEIQDVLTPAHFLLGSQWIALPQHDTSNTSYNRLSHWQAIQKMLQLLWTRWYKEYVHTLQQRWKWNHDEANLEPGQIVLIKEENPFVNCWRMGKVTQVHPGKDGKVRLVTLKTTDGEIQRVIHKLCPLPIQ